MKLLPWTWLIILSLSSALAAQESGWSETRFHRIYLRNGNFVDGILVQDTPTLVILKVKAGEFSIRKDQIARDEDGKYLVVLVKMRSYNEKPQVTEIKKEDRQAPPEAVVRPQPAATPEKRDWKPIAPPTGTREEQLAAYVSNFNDAPIDQKGSVLEKIRGFGKEGVIFLAHSLPSLEEGSQRSALGVLFEAREPETLPIFRKFLADKSPSVRSNAADALARLGEPGDASAIRPLLKDADGGVRASAIGALGKLKDRDSFDAIAGSLADADDIVRKQAFEALGAIAAQFELKEEFQRAVLNVLERSTGPALLDILKLASRTKEKALGAPMARLLSHEDPAVRAQALIAIGQLNASDVADQVLALFNSEREYWPRVQLAGAAGAMKLKDAIEPLIRWLGDDDKNIQAAASRALQQITGQNYGLNQEPWQKWWESRPK